MQAISQHLQSLSTFEKWNLIPFVGTLTSAGQIALKFFAKMTNYVPEKISISISKISYSHLAISLIPFAGIIAIIVRAHMIQEESQKQPSLYFKKPIPLLPESPDVSPTATEQNSPIFFHADLQPPNFCD